MGQVITVTHLYTANTENSNNAVSMLAHRLRCWSGIETALGECPVFAGYADRNDIRLHMCYSLHHSTVQSQKAVSAYFTSKQILPFGFAEQHWQLLPIQQIKIVKRRYMYPVDVPRIFSSSTEQW